MITPALNLTDAQSTNLASLAARLQNRDTLPPLAPKESWNEGLQAVLEGMEESELLGRDDADPDYARAVKSGLLLWNDSLNESHSISQGIPNVTGSYWHGIMHRREPDFSNAKYWFRQVGDHPIFPSLREQAIGVFRSVEDTSEYARMRLQQIEGTPQWDPFAFVDWCEEAVSNSQGSHDEAHLLEAVQLREIELLITHSYRKAVGSD
ncbi:MAG: hypothetical protein KY468_10350 [Armatimonadetes bacterium]|nr:hypothetical protein [Armatimonadota bacterium]